MTITLSDSLSDAVVWQTLKQTRWNIGASVRTEALKPYQSLFQVFRLSVTEAERVGEYQAVVEDVIVRRHHLAQQSGDVRVDLQQGMNGGVLALLIASTMYDEVASHLTDGFFDESDAPPWDLWLDLLVCDPSSDGEGPLKVLLSWIPEEHILLARTGVEGCPSGCLFWFLDPVRLIHPSTDLSEALTKILRRGGNRPFEG